MNLWAAAQVRAVGNMFSPQIIIRFAYSCESVFAGVDSQTFVPGLATSCFEALFVLFIFSRSLFTWPELEQIKVPSSVDVNRLSISLSIFLTTLDFCQNREQIGF